MKYKAVIYDLDGTILDSRADVVNSTKATIKHMGGVMLDDSVIYHYVGKGLIDLVSQSLADLSAAELKRAVTFFNDHYHEHCIDESRMYDGCTDLVHDLKNKNIRQAVFTNKPQVHTDKILAGLNCKEWFDFVHGAETGHAYKPDIKTTEHVLNNLQVKASEALMIGDSHVDFHTAKNAGMDCILLYHGFSTRNEIAAFKSDALALCEDLHEVRAVLNKL